MVRTSLEGTALFVFAHQDDELAYVVRLRTLVSQGRRLRIVWVTDGSGTAPPEVRRAESLKTMGMLGVDPAELVFWEYPDAEALRFLGEITGRLRREMEDIRPAEVYTVAYEGGHPDHDTVHAAAALASRSVEEPPALYEAPLYNGYRSRLGAVNRFVPAPTETIYTPQHREDLLLKLKIMLNYESQFWITVLPILLLGGRRLLGPGEPYRRVPSWNYLQPPHEGKIYYERFPMRRFVDVRFADFRNAVADAPGFRVQES